jgi:excisionase family DNA binding protein
VYVPKSSQVVPSRPQDVLGDVPRCGCAVPCFWLMVSGMALTAPQINDTTTGMPVGRGLTRDEVMTAREVADLLHLPVSTVYYLARRGEIPACRLGRTWRFLRPRIEQLLGS